MEVHAHTHTARKKWTHYFWEFLMLFLAVFCGFLAENFREHQVEHQREKQFMITLVEDLNEDIVVLNKQISDGISDVAQLDTLITILSNKNNTTQNSRLYYLGRTASRHDIFNYNNRTIEQMRNSGGFRLVRKQQVAKLVMLYYKQIKLLEMLEGIEKNEEQEYRKSAIRVFDPVIFNSMVTDRDSVIMPAGNPALLTRDPNLLTDLAGWTQYMKSSVSGVTVYKKSLKQSAGDLIAVIKKEYRLKK